MEETQFGFFLTTKRIIKWDVLTPALKIQVTEDIDGGKHRKLGEILRDDFKVFDNDKLEELLKEFYGVKQ